MINLNRREVAGFIKGFSDNMDSDKLVAGCIEPREQSSLVQKFKEFLGTRWRFL